MSKYDLTDNCPRGERHPETCNIAHDRLNLEAKIVRSLIRDLKAEGWIATSVYTDMHEDVRTETQTMDCVFSVDESTITFSKDGKRRGVLVVLGNGCDVIADYNVSRDESDGWNALMEATTDALMEQYDG
jgi:hypothetical protein